MTQETITLQGGPADGRKVGWCGGDVVIVPFIPEDEPERAVAGSVMRDVTIRTLTYRRSSRPHVFTYQGMEL